MPHRLNVTLSDQDYATLSEYAALMQKPPTTMIGDLVREMLPSMKAVIEAARLAESDKALAMNTLLSLALNQIGKVSASAQKEIEGL